MTKTIAMFNNKGGVSKTTTTFNLGWMLASRGKTVIMVDADPQCNLTGMVLDLKEEDALAKFYGDHPKQNLRDALQPAFASRPVPLEAVDCIEVEGRSGLFLIPGHVGLAEDEVSLGIAQQLSESVQALRNLPGSFHRLFALTAEKYHADYIIVDLSPGLGSINQNLVSTADYFLVPASPDVFSVMAMDSLSRVLPRWASWARSASQLEALIEADYPFPEPNLKFLGSVVQRYRLRDGSPTKAFKSYFDALDAALDKSLLPALEKAGLLLEPAEYTEAGLEGTLRLASIPDFNTLIAESQKLRKPVFTLTKAELATRGVVWDNYEQSIDSFYSIFTTLAERVEKLTGDQ
ncbi:ParA family protein [Rathayibacter festucae]|uniref:AAA domain-containing protein n=1 Tax=Rathayibacter festucae DSM 15932 TaxID=1328866 RepID=A0A3Q9V315_9MICO|nr:AAA family ATPase [Rathayibacter festucae]AZZ54095.1 hypothetical protein C1I64_01375 [Rathayibacter festucae DSM 15932]